MSSEALVTGLRDVAISAGSACNSDSLEPSYILTGIGLSNEEANQSVRICLSSRLTDEEVRTAAARICAKVSSIQCVNTLI
ncbi:Cysteine desulfurase [compost metagenome]